jgi:hypothetical protein
MLAKLRISNEKEWLKGEYDSKHTYEDQFTEAYKDLKETLKEHKIPLSIFSSCSSGSQCQFLFNGFDSKTNTYFFEFIGTIG